MPELGTRPVRYVEADERLTAQVVDQWREYMPSVGRYIRLNDGFTIVALAGDQVVGLVAVRWAKLAEPLRHAVEAVIDDLEVLDDYRRRGIGRRLIAEAESKARALGACQLRAWSASGATEAIHMWKALGFGLCPATMTSELTREQVSGYHVAKSL